MTFEAETRINLGHPPSSQTRVYPTHLHHTLHSEQARLHSHFKGHFGPPLNAMTVTVVHRVGDEHAFRAAGTPRFGGVFFPRGLNVERHGFNCQTRRKRY